MPSRRMERALLPGFSSLSRLSWIRAAVGALGLVLASGPVVGAEAAGAITAAPLAPRGATGQAMRFTVVSPEASGVKTENKYDDPRMWSDLYQEFLFGALGTGVAIGDYDGDGRPDVFVVSKTESCRLFRNLGEWKFEEVTARAGVEDAGPAAKIWKQGATFVDINNDGRLDLYVCRFGAPNLLYVNRGDGTFAEEARQRGLDLTDASGMAAFADYDRDGALDVYIATNLLDNKHSAKGQRGILLHNRGDGTFENVTERAGITDESQSHSSAWWDFDNDGWPDLYVANDFGAPDKLYRNNHDGTFTDRLRFVAPHTAYSAMGTDVGDVNNDGLIDLLVGDMAASTHQKDQRGPADLRSRDAEPPDDGSVLAKYRRNALLLNTGTAQLQGAANLAGLAVTDWTWAVRFEDFDNDGWLDLFACNGMVKEENMDVNARMMRAESSAERIRIMRESPLLFETNRAYRNRGDLQFEDISKAWGVDQRSISFGAATGDLDGDGDLDVVYTNYQAGATVLRNESSSGHRLVLALRGVRSNRFGIGATVRVETAAGQQVRQLWLTRGYMSGSEPVVHFGLGEETRVRRLVVTWPSGLEQTFSDLAADQRYTITEPDAAPTLKSGSTPRPVAQFEPFPEKAGLTFAVPDERFDETSQQRLLPFRLNRRGPGVAVGDFSGEGRDGIVLAGTTLTPMRLLSANADRSFAPASQSLPPGIESVDDGPPLLFDVDGDGRLDLLRTKGGNSHPAGSPDYQPRLYFNRGSAGWSLAPAGVVPEFPASVGAAAAVDFDRDGKLDVFLGGRLLPGMYPDTPRSALWRNQGGRFEDVTEKVAPGLREVGLVTSALWSDLDDDGWPDLVVATEWGTVRCFHNEHGQRFTDWTERAGFAQAGTGWWTALASADFNGDGRPDLVAGNAGLNTVYRATPTRPALLFSGDFSGDEQPQLVEAYHEGDTIYPRRSRRDLGSVIPGVLRRYQRNDVFARASLAEIVGADRLQTAQRFAATELRSGVFLSQSDGSYRFVPLPNLAQIAPMQGVVAGDFDGDGRADIYCVQNSYAPVAAIGRFDGGISQLLRGDGKGGWKAVAPAESGLVVPGNAKGLVCFDPDADGWPDFWVTRNNDTALAFHNRGVEGHRSQVVRLRGNSGNPSAIGAKLTVTYRDGSRYVAEISAGGGWASQSSASVFVGSSMQNPAKEVTVRWPDGATSTHAWPATSVVEITRPR